MPALAASAITYAASRGPSASAAVRNRTACRWRPPNRLALELGEDVARRAFDCLAPSDALRFDLGPTVERALVERVIETAPIGAVADLRAHERPLCVPPAVLVPRRDEDAARQGVKGQRAGDTVERIAACAAFGEMVDAEAAGAGLHAQVGEGLEADARLDVLVAVAFDHDGDRVEDDQADVREALNRLRQRRHVGGWVKRPFPLALAHASDEVHVGPPAARR